MGMIHSYTDKDGEYIAIWLPGDTAKARHLLDRVRIAFANELQDRFRDGDWDVREMLETGAEIAKFLETKEAEANASV